MLAGSQRKRMHRTNHLPSPSPAGAPHFFFPQPLASGDQPTEALTVFLDPVRPLLLARNIDSCDTSGETGLRDWRPRSAGVFCLEAPETIWRLKFQTWKPEAWGPTVKRLYLAIF